MGHARKYQLNMRAYFRMLTGIDHVMDRVLKALEQAGLAESTIIVYTADNGSHGRPRFCRKVVASQHPYGAVGDLRSPPSKTFEAARSTHGSQS